MLSTTALLLATPIFGLTLVGPVPLDAGAGVFSAAAAAPNSAPARDGSEAAKGGTGPAVVAGSIAAGGLPGSVLPGAIAMTPATQAVSDDDFASQMRSRVELTKIHKPLGIATWVSMSLTLALGGIQYHNLYGSFDDLGDTPCVRGDAIFGQGQCSGTPWLHLSSALLTTALYSATLGVAARMPDPDNLSEGDSAYARNLRMHKLLRWVHLGGMAAQMVMGLVVANSHWFGIDRANDYETQRALSTAHMGLGLVTYGALTWAGALMVFD